MRRARESGQLKASAANTVASREAGPTRWVIWALLCILLLALGMDFVFYTGLCASDDLQYINAARQVGMYGHLRRVQPGSVRLMMVIPLAIVTRLAHHNLFVVTASAVVWHLIVILLTFWLARLVHGPRTGIIAAGLVAVCPTAVLWATTIFPDMPVTALSLLALCIAFGAGKWQAGALTRRSSLIYLGVGLAIGLAYMVKETAYVLIPFCGVLVLLDTRKTTRRHRFVAPAMLALGLLIVLVGETAMLSALARKPVFRPTMMRGMEELTPEVRAKVQAQGTNPLDRFQELQKRHMNDAYFGYFRWALAASVLLYPFLRARSWRLWLLFLWIFGYLCFGTRSIHHYFPPSLQPRYLIYPLPLGLALVAYTLDSAGLWLWRRASGRWATTRLFVVGAIALGCAVVWHSASRANALAGHLYSSYEASGTRQAVDFAMHNDDRIVVLSSWLGARMGPMYYKVEDPRLLLPGGDATPALAMDLIGEYGSFLYIDGGHDQRWWHAAPKDSEFDVFLQSALAGGTSAVQARTVAQFTQFESRWDAIWYILGGTFGRAGKRVGTRTVYLREVSGAAPPTPGAPVATQPSVEGLTFQSVTFQDPVATTHISAWKKNSKKVTVTREGDGLRCEVEGGSGPESNYGGVTFPVSGEIKALRLELTLVNPENVSGVWVDGIAGKARRLRWVWRPSKAASPAGRATYVLVPGEKSGPFRAERNESAKDFQRVDVFIRLRGPGQKAGFVLHRAEVAS